MKKIYLSIVVPLYNENESLNPLVKSIECALQKMGKPYEYIFVDDGSTDGSFDTLVRIKKSVRSLIRIIKFRKNVGKSAALAAAFDRVQGEFVITIDADLQDDPAEIPAMIDRILAGYDLVVGWRRRREDKQGKIRLSRIFNSVVSYAYGISLHDMNSGLKAFRRSVVSEIELYGEMHRFIPVIASAQGFRVTEIPVVHHERKFGVSKFGTSRIIHAAFDLITTVFLSSFKTRPLQVFGPIGFGFIVSGIVPLLYLSYLHFQGQSIGTRPLLTLGVLFVLFGVQIFSTGLIGELMISLHSRKDKYPIDEDLV